MSSNGMGGLLYTSHILVCVCGEGGGVPINSPLFLIIVNLTL